MVTDNLKVTFTADDCSEILEQALAKAGLTWAEVADANAAYQRGITEGRRLQAPEQAGGRVDE
jgi:hypothetical protein